MTSLLYRYAYLLSLELASSLVELWLVVWTRKVLLHCLVDEVVLLSATFMVGDADGMLVANRQHRVAPHIRRLVAYLLLVIIVIDGVIQRTLLELAFLFRHCD